MKTNFLITLFLFFALAKIQAQSFESVKAYEGECTSARNKDQAGNSYELREGPNLQTYLRKLSPDKTLLWEVLTPLFTSYNSHLNTDPWGNILVTGNLNNSEDQIIVLKYNPSGNELWNFTPVQWEGTAEWNLIRPQAVTIDANGSLYVSGMLEGHFSFGSTVIMSPNLDTLNTEDFFPLPEAYIFKLDTGGTIAWAQKVYNENNLPIHEFKNAAIDPSGNLIISGNLDYEGDIWLGKFTSGGQKIWQTETEGFFGALMYNFRELNDMTIDNLGNVYLAGNITGNFHFGDYTVSCKYTTTIWEGDSINEPITEAWMAKIGADGEVKWVKQTDTKNGTIFTGGTAAKADNHGNVYFTGYFDTQTSLGGVSLMALGVSDLFIVKYDSNGNQEWVLSGGGTNAENTRSFCIDDNGNAFIHGSASGTSNFGVLSWNSPEDFYVKVAAPQETPFYLYRVNCGGPTLTDTHLNWSEDRQTIPYSYLDPISSNHTTGTFYSWNGTNTTGAPKDVFGPNRYDVPAGGPLSYNFPVPVGVYLINLYFAEKPNGITAAGQRIFDIHLDEREALAAYDIFKNAGLSADKKSFILTVLDGMLEIDFIRQTGNPQVNGIEIISMNHSAPETAHRSPAIVSNEQSHSLYYLANPVRESILLSSNDEENAPATVYVYDQMGRMVYDQVHHFSNGALEIIPANHLSPGIYFLKINKETLKFVKE